MKIEKLKIAEKWRTVVLGYYRILIGGSRLYFIRLSTFDVSSFVFARDFLAFSIRYSLNLLSSLSRASILLLINLRVNYDIGAKKSIPERCVFQESLRLIKYAITHSEKMLYSHSQLILPKPVLNMPHSSSKRSFSGLTSVNASSFAVLTQNIEGFSAYKSELLATLCAENQRSDATRKRYTSLSLLTISISKYLSIGNNAIYYN